MKIVISGSRRFQAKEVVVEYVKRLPRSVEIVVGASWNKYRNQWEPEGVDRWVAETATDRQHPMRTFAADWQTCTEDCKPGHRRKRHDGSTYCPTAGHRRNAEMVEYGDALVAFWDGSSRGTKDAFKRAQDAKIPWGIVVPDGNGKFDIHVSDDPVNLYLRKRTGH